jgi:hypothetical protein
MLSVTLSQFRLTVENRTHFYIKVFDRRYLGNHFIQLCIQFMTLRITMSEQTQKSNICNINHNIYMQGASFHKARNDADQPR